MTFELFPHGGPFLSVWAWPLPWLLPLQSKAILIRNLSKFSVGVNVSADADRNMKYIEISLQIPVELLDGWHQIHLLQL